MYRPAVGALVLGLTRRGEGAEIYLNPRKEGRSGVISYTTM